MNMHRGESGSSFVVVLVGVAIVAAMGVRLCLTVEELKAAHSRLSAVGDRYAETKRIADALQIHKQSLAEEVDQVNAEMAQLRDALKDRDEKLQQLSKKLEASIASSSQAGNAPQGQGFRADPSKDAIEAAQKALVNKDAAIQRLTLELQRMNVVYDSAKRNLDEAKSQVAALNTRLMMQSKTGARQVVSNNTAKDNADKPLRAPKESN